MGCPITAVRPDSLLLKAGRSGFASPAIKPLAGNTCRDWPILSAPSIYHRHAAWTPIAPDRPSRPDPAQPRGSGNRPDRRQLPPPGRWRVFISHTSELQDYPSPGHSYVDRAAEAVRAEGHDLVNMASFCAEDNPPSHVDKREVRQCDVFIGIIGMRYGSLVRSQSEMSHTEQEFEAATEHGIQRLMFLLDRKSLDLKLPGDYLRDGAA
ncbi:MAG: DUF4062 domain-containing protein [Cyanobacteriota bacterium]